MAETATFPRPQPRLTQPSTQSAQLSQAPSPSQKLIELEASPELPNVGKKFIEYEAYEPPPATIEALLMRSNPNHAATSDGSTNPAKGVTGITRPQKPLALGPLGPQTENPTQTLTSLVAERHRLREARQRRRLGPALQWGRQQERQQRAALKLDATAP